MASCTLTETESVKVPLSGVIVGVATVGIVAWLIDRLNDVVFVTPPAFPVTLSVYVPTGAELFV